MFTCPGRGESGSLRPVLRLSAGAISTFSHKMAAAGSRATAGPWPVLMDLSADSGTLLTHISRGDPDVEREPSAFNAARQTESVSLHLLEFRICLLEAVEELHIRRGAETRLEDQISKLVVEKQELEWQKESLQHQIEMLTNQHTESLTGVKKQFQAKIKAIEEEKGKHQLSAELKDKEINSLKEELKSLQLFKYSLEKKSSELEQKLALQSRLKDSHLKQLGEVEKRFSALCRKCAVLKQAHDKLEQNVAEAMRVNTQLNSTNKKQETAISSLKQEAEELNNQVMKAKVLRSGLCEATDHSATEQHVQQLQHRLLMETELTRKVMDENAAERTGKQKVVRSLQHAQLLLLSQTQLVSRVEQELHTQKQENLALKREHEVMREKSKAAEDKLAQLMEDYATSKTIWDKEKRDLRAVTEAYDQLRQKHTELSSQAALQAQYTQELETRGYSHSRSVSDLLSPSAVQRTRGEGLLNEADTSSELPVPGSLQSLAPAQTRDPDGLLVTEAVDKLVTSGATGGPETSIHCQEPQCKQSPPPSNLVTTPSTTSLFSPQTLCGATGNKINSLPTYLPISNTSENDRALVSDLTNTVSDGASRMGVFMKLQTH
ncbi:coiled-coil domain-containing protein 73 [Myripristis murdjan]|uniref:coiled-coil domain-containing protein 73 n=1 Tax=Myripristis murdjan TaxID=586833 RepID=UPI0011761415|nr:coiled-coil domain-containing protein 73 [Myripristis murdjan]